MRWTRSLRVGFLAFVAALTTTGCVKFDEKATIAKDGSGSITLNFVVDVAKLKELKDTFAAFMPAPQAPPAMEDEPAMGEPKKDAPPSPYGKEAMEKLLKQTEGNELKEHSIALADGKETVHMLIAFKSFENLCKTGALISLAVTLVKNEDGSYAMTLDPKAGYGGASGGGGGEMEMLAGMLPMLEPIVGGLEFKAELAVPGTIVETNGTKSEDATKATWTIDWKAISGADKTKPDAATMKVSFKGEGIDIKPFSYKPDVMAMGAKFGLGGSR